MLSCKPKKFFIKYVFILASINYTQSTIFNYMETISNQEKTLNMCF